MCKYQGYCHMMMPKENKEDNNIFEDSNRCLYKHRIAT